MYKYLYLAYVPRVGDYTVMTPQTLKRGRSKLCTGTAIGWAPQDGGAVPMVGEACRKLRLSTHRIGSKVVLLQLRPT